MFSKTLPSALALAGVASAGALVQRQDTCVNPSVVYVTTYQVEYPVIINSYIEENTIININGGVTININNAPTSLITTVTATDTVTSTATATVTDVVPPASTISPNDVFILEIIGAPGAKAKRAISYVGFSGGSGITVPDKSDAAKFSSDQGQVLSPGGLLGVMDPDVTTGYARFGVFGQPDVSREFNVELDGDLGFNPVSNAGVSLDLSVTFCITNEGFIFTVLDTPPPFECITISLGIVVVSGPDATSTSSISGSTTGTATTTSATSGSQTTTATSPTFTHSGNSTSTNPTSSHHSTSTTIDLSGDVRPTPTVLAPKRRQLKHIPAGSKMIKRGGLFRSPVAEKK